MQTLANPIGGTTYYQPNQLSGGSWALLIGGVALVGWLIFSSRTTQAAPEICRIATAEDFHRLDAWGVANNILVVYLRATEPVTIAQLLSADSPFVEEVQSAQQRGVPIVVVTGDGRFWRYQNGTPVLAQDLRAGYCAFQLPPA